MKKYIFIFIIAGVVFLPGQGFAAKKKVLVIESYHPTLTWTQQCDKGIESILADHADIDFFYMDTKRIPESEFQPQADRAWALYQTAKPDLVMIGDDNGLRLLGPPLARTNTPVVFFGINSNPRLYFETMPTNITGLLERTPVIPWLRYLARIIPKAHSALVLMDKSHTSEAIIQMNFQGKTHFTVEGIRVDCHMVDTWDQWQTLVTNASSYSLLLFPTFHAVKNKEGAHVSIEEVIAWTSAHSPIPLFSNQDYTVNDAGVVGAYVIYGESHGSQAARMALDVLLGSKRPGQSPPTIDRTGLFFFNKTQLNRFNLALPKEIEGQAIFQ